MVLAGPRSESEYAAARNHPLSGKERNLKGFVRVIKFTLFSASAGLIELGSFALLNELLRLPYWLSYFVALLLSVLWNFTLNRRYTFRSAANVPVAMAKVAAYYAVFLPLSTWLEHVLTVGLGWNEYLVTVLNMLLNFVTEFLYQRFFVFGKTLDTNAAANRDAETAPGGRSPSLLYRFIKFLVRLFYPKTQVVGAEKLPPDAAVIVGNHAQLHGPIACELYVPGEHYTWCVGQMMHLKEVPAYAYVDFWSGKPKAVRWFYKLLSYLIAPLSVCIFNNANTIPVYRDKRIISTFRTTAEKLSEGASVVIFPEQDAPHNNILCEFQDGFVDVARFYYKKTGVCLQFVPLYVAPALRKLYVGTPIRFNADAPIKEERERICAYLTQEITKIAQGLPVHRVVPYKNVPKRNYPRNVTGETQENAAVRS